MGKKKLLAVAFCAAALMGSSGVANAAQPPPEELAEHGPEHARSICSFSGINDQSEGPGPRTQSYGQEVRGPDAQKPSEGPKQGDTPGFFCNPEKGPFEGPFEGGVEE